MKVFIFRFVMIIFIIFLSCYSCRDLFMEYGGPEAPNDTYYFLVDRIKQNRLRLCNKSAKNDKYFGVVITIEDSIIVTCHILNSGFDSIRQNQIENLFLGEQVDFSFIEDYNYGSYSFRVNYRKLCRKIK